MFINKPSVYKQISPNPKRPQPIWLSTIWEIGKWEMAGGTDFPISQFPKRPQPIWLSTIWEIWKQAEDGDFPISQMIPAQMAQDYLGNWDFPISQFPKRPQPIWLSTIWEIGKWLEVQISQFPNFPKDPSPSGSALRIWETGKLGNLYIGMYFPISLFPKRSQPTWLSTIWEIGKLGNL